jgi:hypothetical protein
LPVSSLQFTNLGPFDEVAFEFDRQVNVFVGPNNCGKTTALLALADILVWPFLLPVELLRGDAEFRISIDSMPPKMKKLHGSLPFHRLGRVFNDEHRGWCEADGFKQHISSGVGYRAFVPALRLSTGFRATAPRSVSATTPNAEVKNAWWVRDEQVIQQLIDLDYLGYREKKPAVRKLISKIAGIAAHITQGFAIEFAGVAEDKTGLFPEFKTPDGVLPFNFLSQGTQSVIQWCADLLIGYAKFYDFPNTLDDKPGILIIDEIDAHLHPSWQRRILPVLTSEFPSLQIFCATHSPLTISGLKAGQVHLLKRDANGKISVSRNETDIQGWSADEIYGTLLGVEPTDLATTEKLDRLHQLRRKGQDLTRQEQEELDALREEVHQGLAGPLPAEQVEAVAGRLKQAAHDNAEAKANPAGHKKSANTAKRTAKKTAPPARRRKR